MKKRPNIIIFNPEQFRSDALGHLGNPAAITPNMDSICKSDGVSFQNAFCQYPMCTPSRCSFMSGWYSHVKGHRTQHYLMHEDEPVLLKNLKDNDYFVWWGGKNDLIPDQGSFKPYCNIRHVPNKTVAPMWGNFEEEREKLGKDYSYSWYTGKIEKNKDSEYYYDYDWDCVMSAIEFIHKAPENKPFCIYLSLLYAHPPYAVEEPWYSMIDRKKIPKRIPTPVYWDNKSSRLKKYYELQGLRDWTEEQWTELRATYYGMCSRVDYQLGLLMKALKKTGIYDDTAVFVFSDHGDFVGDYGIPEKITNTFEEGLIKVPFIIKPPASVAVKPRISKALIELIDFPATVEELTGIKPKHTHFGRSLVNILLGETDFHRDAVFCEGGKLHGESHCNDMLSMKEAILDKNKKLEDSILLPYFTTQMSDGPESTKTVMIRNNKYKYVMRLYESDLLYDLINDPQETNNRIKDPSLSGVLIEMKERLLKFYLETCDVVPHEQDERGKLFF